MERRQRNSRRGLMLLAMASSGAWFSGIAHAATDTWTGAGANTTWSTTANWAGGVPSTADTALFNIALVSGTVGGSTNPVLIDSGRNILNMTFDTAAAGAYVIGTTSGNTLAIRTPGSAR